MKNQTSVNYFYLLPSFGESSNKALISTLFFIIYLVGVLINSSVIAVISMEVQLHKPMYLFICNLSIVDIFYTSITVPKLLHMFLTGNNIVFFSQCYTQFYFFISAATAEDTLLFIMAYGRYVAICLPLHYHHILSWKNCLMITIGIWTAAFINSLIIVISVFYMSSCRSNVIHQFFCNLKSLTITSCTAMQMFFVVFGIEILIFGIIPLMGTFISYFNIFSVIFRMKSKENRKKAFSTCSSHVTIISIYYGTSVAEYLIPAYSDILDSFLNLVFATVTPTINPIIYSMQNSNIQSALLKLVLQLRKKMCILENDSKNIKG